MINTYPIDQCGFGDRQKGDTRRLVREKNRNKNSHSRKNKKYKQL